MSETTHKRSRAARVEDAALVALFVAAIWLPLAAMLFPGGAAAGSAENRLLTQMPPAPQSWRELAAYPDGFGKYFKDNFGFRPSLIRWDATWKVKWLGVSTTPNVLVGKDGWLFYSGKDSLEAYRSLPPFTPEQLALWQSALEARRDWLKRRGAAYVFVVVPEKESVYPEYMPAGARARAGARPDQLLAYLKQHSDLEVVDLRPALLRAKPAHQLYLRTDTHWNYFGAFAGYQAVISALSKTFKGMEPIKPSDCVVTPSTFSDGDLAKLLGLAGQIKEELPIMSPKNQNYRTEGVFPQTVTTEQEAAGLPRLVMFRDSFASAAIPFLSQHFSRAVYPLGYNFNFDAALVERERPDAVIQESAERFLSFDPPGDGLPKPEATRARPTPRARE